MTEKKTMSPKTAKVLKITGISLVSLIAILGILFWLAVQDENSGKYSSSPSINVFSKIVVAAATTKEVYISDQDINGLLAYQFVSDDNTSNNLNLEGIYTDMSQNGDEAKIYIPIKYNGIHFAVTGKIKPSLSSDLSKVEIDIYDTKIGKLPISSREVAKSIATEIGNGVTNEGSKILFDSTLKFDFQGQKISLQIQKCEIKDGNLILQTKGTVGALEPYLKDNFGIDISSGENAVNSLLDKLNSFINTK